MNVPPFQTVRVHACTTTAKRDSVTFQAIPCFSIFHEHTPARIAPFGGENTESDLSISICRICVCLCECMQMWK